MCLYGWMVGLLFGVACAKVQLWASLVCATSCLGFMRFLLIFGVVNLLWPLQFLCSGAYACWVRQRFTLHYGLLATEYVAKLKRHKPETTTVMSEYGNNELCFL